MFHRQIGKAPRDHHIQHQNSRSHPGQIAAVIKQQHKIAQRHQPTQNGPKRSPTQSLSECINATCTGRQITCRIPSKKSQRQAQHPIKHRHLQRRIGFGFNAQHRKTARQLKQSTRQCGHQQPNKHLPKLTPIGIGNHRIKQIPCHHRHRQPQPKTCASHHQHHMDIVF